MAHSVYATKIEQLVREYRDALNNLKQSPLYTATGDGVVYRPNSGGMELAERYEKARQNLAAVGVCLESVLCVRPSSISSGVTTGFEGLDIRLMPQASTWARGYHALRDSCVADVEAGRAVVHPSYVLDGQTIYRPLTLGEILRARIADAHRHDNVITETPSWNRWSASCTAIIYGQNGQFKVQKISSDLLNLDADFHQAFYQGQYDAINGEGAMEFRRNAKYGQFLTKDEVRSHPFWQFVADGNADLLREYTDLQWAGRDAGYKSMAIRLCDNPQVGGTWVLYVDSHKYSSVVYGFIYLHNNSYFLQVAPREVR